MSLYPGFFHDGGAVAHETAGADVEFGCDIGTVGLLVHKTDDTEFGGVEAHDFQTGGIEKATTDQGGDFAGSGLAVITLSPPPFDIYTQGKLYVPLKLFCQPCSSSFAGLLPPSLLILRNLGEGGTLRSAGRVT